MVQTRFTPIDWSQINDVKSLTRWLRVKWPELERAISALVTPTPVPITPSAGGGSGGSSGTPGGSVPATPPSVTATGDEIVNNTATTFYAGDVLGVSGGLWALALGGTLPVRALVVCNGTAAAGGKP